MHNYKLVFLGIALVACGFNNLAMATQLPCEAKLVEAAISQNVFYFSESQAYPVTKRTCGHFVEKLHLSAAEPRGINSDEQFWNHAKAEVGKHPIKSKLDMETLMLSVTLPIQ